MRDYFDDYFETADGNYKVATIDAPPPHLDDMMDYAEEIVAARDAERQDALTRENSDLRKRVRELEAQLQEQKRDYMIVVHELEAEITKLKSRKAKTDVWNWRYVVDGGTHGGGLQTHGGSEKTEIAAYKAIYKFVQETFDDLDITASYKTVDEVRMFLRDFCDGEADKWSVEKA
jgi:hypothetical protein